MMQTKIYDTSERPTDALKAEVVSFLYEHLQQYGDAPEDIGKCYDYAMRENGGGGGHIFVTYDDNEPVGVCIVNRTGMEGYIPENILVYIATHKDKRGTGIGKQLMQTVIDTCDGNIALHVEHDNPAAGLYRKLGFTNKYLEMRLNKKEAKDGVYNAG